MLFLYFLLTFFLIVLLALQINEFKSKHFSLKVAPPSFPQPCHPHTPLGPTPCGHTCSFLSYLSLVPVQCPSLLPFPSPLLCQCISMKIFQCIDKPVEFYGVCPPRRCYNEHFAIFASPHSRLSICPLSVCAFSFVSFSSFLCSPHTCIVFVLFPRATSPVRPSYQRSPRCWRSNYLLLELIFHNVSFRKRKTN